MEREFKLGDEVKFKPFMADSEAYVGKVGVLVRIEELHYHVNFKNLPPLRGGRYKNRFELASNADMGVVVSLFRSGVLIEEGTQHIYIPFDEIRRLEPSHINHEISISTEVYEEVLRLWKGSSI